MRKAVNILTAALAMTILAVVALPSIANEPGTPDPFPDITGHWAIDTIRRAHEMGLILGYPNGTFKPDDNISNAEAVSLINRYFELTKTGDVTFPDVRPGSWYYYDVSVAVGMGYADGFEDGTFRPDADMIRLQTMVMLHRIIGSPAAGSPALLAEFSDAAAVTGMTQEAENAILFLIQDNILHGYPDGTLRLDNSITRAEMLVLLLRINRDAAVKDTPALPTSDPNQDFYEIWPEPPGPVPPVEPPTPQPTAPPPTASP